MLTPGPRLRPFTQRDTSTYQPHVIVDGCTCDACEHARLFPHIPTPRELARGKMYARGLSNTAYLAASPRDVTFEVQATLSRVRFRLRDDANKNSGTAAPRGGRRGEVRELSEGARSRLADRAWSLSEEGHEPVLMLTLTSPANWRDVYVLDPETGEILDGGRILKAQLAAFRKRLNRVFRKHLLIDWSALWFLEFQQRGAPHLHLMLFGCSISDTLARSLRGWIGRAWSSLVGNPNPEELAKHRRAGTQVARMKTKHFGYAVKYATKTEQKVVPEEFRSVGRFWGVWNHKPPMPILLPYRLDLTDDQQRGLVYDVLLAALGTLADVAPGYAQRWTDRLDRLLTSTGLRRSFGFAVFGRAASVAAVDAAPDAYLYP